MKLGAENKSGDSGLIPELIPDLKTETDCGVLEVVCSSLFVCFIPSLCVVGTRSPSRCGRWRRAVASDPRRCSLLRSAHTPDWHAVLETSRIQPAYPAQYAYAQYIYTQYVYAVPGNRAQYAYAQYIYTQYIHTPGGVYGVEGAVRVHGRASCDCLGLGLARQETSSEAAGADPSRMTEATPSASHSTPMPCVSPPRARARR